MNALTGKTEYALHKPADDETLAKLLMSLFGSLQHEQEGATTRAVLGNYLDVLSDIPEWAVEQACALYRRGHKGNGRFVPMAAELAQTARGLIVARETMERERAAYDREAALIAQQIAENERWKRRSAGITPESRARVQQKLEAAKAIIAANQLDDEGDRQGPDIHQATHDKYRHLGREALVKVLKGQRPR